MRCMISAGPCAKRPPHIALPWPFDLVCSSMSDRPRRMHEPNARLVVDHRRQGFAHPCVIFVEPLELEAVQQPSVDQFEIDGGKRDGLEAIELTRAGDLGVTYRDEV